MSQALLSVQRNVSKEQKRTKNPTVPAISCDVPGCGDMIGKSENVRVALDTQQLLNKHSFPLGPHLIGLPGALQTLSEQTEQ